MNGYEQAIHNICMQTLAFYKKVLDTLNVQNVKSD